MARIFRAGLLAGVIGLLTAMAVMAQGDPSLARTWDSAITLLPGGYRAPKPITLKGNFDVTISPWTLIDGVTFGGVQSGQRWHLNGTIMHRVSLYGQLGVAMNARNSVFEDCDMGKTGGWFVSWWGSHWDFDNCIFTTKFLGNDLDVGNYSIHATGCTFYDVNLATIVYRGNPVDYLQKGDMGFVNCRFVRCKVPEAFLAATVNCVFEDCEFPAKREKWPDAMTPVMVNAMYAGLTEAPESFMNGALSVQFSEAPMNVTAGTTLQHTESGGEITLNNYSPPMSMWTWERSTSSRAKWCPRPGIRVNSRRRPHPPPRGWAGMRGNIFPLPI